MAVEPIGTKYNGFTFDGVSSKAYGVYVTKVNVFSAPKREAELIEIPGRNGAFVLDKKRFSNIEVKYDCLVAAPNGTDYADALSAFRNALASRIGYKRLECDLAPDEYRMAVFKDGVSITNINADAGEFDIVFNCKPQRYLTSGETKASVASGATMTNPTLFDAHPLIECGGSGVIGFNGCVITVANSPIGTIVFSNPVSGGAYGTDTITFNSALMSQGDTITIAKGTQYYMVISGANASCKVTDLAIVSRTGMAVRALRGGPYGGTGKGIIEIVLDTQTFTSGTAETKTATITYQMSTVNNGVTTTGTYTMSLAFVYDGAGEIVLNVPAGALPADFSWQEETYSRPEVTGDSTRLSITGTMYFDTDIGEAWTEIDGSVVSVNNSVSFGSELPTLAPGANTITYDNTITGLKITPRWWKV